MNMKFPKYIMIQTNAYCNGKCIFCPYVDVSTEISQGIIADNLFRKIVDECSSYNDVERIMPYLMNEPLMDKNIVKRINYIKSKSPLASVHILTNGSLLTSQLALELVNSKLDWIGISIHGIYQSTIQNTMGLEPETTLNRICNFIEMAKNSKRNIENFVMITFLKHKNLSLEEKEEILEFWQNRGIRRINYFEGPISRAGNVKNLLKVKHNSICGCNSIWTNDMIHILYNGDVILCCMDWRKEVLLGNIKDKSIYEIWTSEKYSYIRDIIDGKHELPNNFLCSRCESAEVTEF